MDKLAPLEKKRIKKDMKQLLYDEQLSNEIQLRHLKERKWKHSRNEYDCIALQYQKRHVTKIIHAKRKQYYNDLFRNISQDTKRLYTEANKLLFQKEELLLSHEEDQKYWLKDSTSSSHQRLKRLWQLCFLQIHIQLMNPI